MPYSVKKTSQDYGVWNKEKKKWKSYNTTKSKAQSQ